MYKGAFESAPTPATAPPAPPRPPASATAFSPVNTNTSWLATPDGQPARNPLQTARPSVTPSTSRSKMTRAQSPLPRPYSSQSSGTKSPSQEADWESAGTWETPAERNSGTTTPSYPLSNNVVLSKEDKAAEMSRRKEERKQVRPRIIIISN